MAAKKKASSEVETEPTPDVVVAEPVTHTFNGRDLPTDIQRYVRSAPSILVDASAHLADGRIPWQVAYLVEYAIGRGASIGDTAEFGGLE